jgi:hypothetical protein
MAAGQPPYDLPTLLPHLWPQYKHEFEKFRCITEVCAEQMVSI